MAVLIIDGFEVMIDDEDLERVLKFHWGKHKAPHNKGIYFANFSKANKYITLHRFIIGACDGDIVDHKNRDTLDNRKVNLRICSVANNTHNSGAMITNRLGIRGVTKRGNTYSARICVDKKPIHIGNFKTSEEAALAYKKASLDYYGEFSPFFDHDAVN